LCGAECANVCGSLQITVLGTPAEEAGGGKIDLLNADAFSDVDVTMMSHPGCYSSAIAEFSSLLE
jgi:metal-dependent amidase/aminoacylase/carboxypeptidase family protein